MEPSRPPKLLVGLSWGIALFTLVLFAAAANLGVSTEGRAPTGDDYKRGCLSILLYIASICAAAAGFLTSTVCAVILRARARWSLACVLAALVSAAPWVVMIVYDAAQRPLTRR